MKKILRRSRRPPKKALKVTKEKLYGILIEMHGWTFDDIANMNTYQQLVAAGLHVNKNSNLIQFSSMAEYHQWRQANG